MERPESLEEQAAMNIPPANPDDPKTRLLRALYGYCPDHDSCTPLDHADVPEHPEDDDDPYFEGDEPEDYDMSDPYDIEYDVP